MLKVIEDAAWCRPDWTHPNLSNDANALLRQCNETPKVELVEDLNELMERSNTFPISFPIHTVRMESLKDSKPVAKLKKNADSTYPIIHERALHLMTQFLINKREHGTSIEKALYKDMTLIEFIDRLLKKRAVIFMGRHDSYLLITGEKGNNGWELVGTSKQKQPLVLENCLSYDEMKLSAYIYVSGYTECINDGIRNNCGKVKLDNVEPDAVIIGVIGPRFKRKNRMDYEDIIISKDQNVPANGYGNEPQKKSNGDETMSKYKLRQLWSDFFQVPNTTYDEVISQVNTEDTSPAHLYKDRYITLPKNKDIFDNEAYYKRIAVLAETTLIEADFRAMEAGKFAFINIVGAGLGVWRMSDHQNDVYVLAFIERVKAFMDEGHLNHVSDINFAYIKISSAVQALFAKKTPKLSTFFIKTEAHPKGGISIHVENRQPASKLTGEHEGKLLVMTFPWDGNAQPGNEFWKNNLKSSGDSAAASSTQISELHNSYINPAVTAQNTMIVGTRGIKHIADYCT